MPPRLFLAFGIAFLLSGCAVPGQGPPSMAKVQKNVTGPPPKNFTNPIAAHLKEVLFDSFSAKTEYGKPEKGWYGNLGALLVPRDIQFAWLVRVRVNAKNRFGAYVGWRAYLFFFEGERMVHVVGR